MGTELDKPAVLTQGMQEDIIRHVADGNYFSVACEAAGTTRQAVEYWRRLWETGVEHAQVYADFFAALKRASAIAEVNAVGAVNRGAFNWQSRAWFLERRFRGRWAREIEKKPNTAKRRDVIVEAQKRAEDRKRNRGSDRPAG